MSDIQARRRIGRTRSAQRETGKVGKRGAVVIPARIRREAGIEEGELVVIEARPDGVLIRPAVALPVEVYSAERKAEFLLNNAVSPADYRRARQAVKALGIDPDQVKHTKLSKG